ncbi:hypothetical protein ACFQ08_45470 [Streptosporangium algeriense]|uniref:Uncharacterized protein n=1 Tax=Streptosporangium algeriense TaxID=1682748 RepID=A0ABW3E9G0_9ACTN
MTADRRPDGWRRRTCDEVIRAYAGIARLPTSPGERRVGAVYQFRHVRFQEYLLARNN